MTDGSRNKKEENQSASLNKLLLIKLVRDCGGPQAKKETFHLYFAIRTAVPYMNFGTQYKERPLDVSLSQGISPFCTSGFLILICS